MERKVDKFVISWLIDRRLVVLERLYQLDGVVVEPMLTFNMFWVEAWASLKWFLRRGELFRELVR